MAKRDCIYASGIVRGSKLCRYAETAGYQAPIVIRLNKGSYAPVIEHNPNPLGARLDADVEALILQTKTALDMRTLRSTWRTLAYYRRIPLSADNPRQISNVLFIPLAAAPIIPGAVSALWPMRECDCASECRRPGARGVQLRRGCIESGRRHNWAAALKSFEKAVENSQGEAKYFWWCTALLASRGRMLNAIEILDSAVRHSHAPTSPRAQILRPCTSCPAI